MSQPAPPPPPPPALPTIRKRVRGSNLRKHASPEEEEEQKSEAQQPMDTDAGKDTDQNGSSLLADLKAARAFRARPRGVDASLLLNPGLSAEAKAAKDAAEHDDDPQIGLSTPKDKKEYMASFTGTNKTLDATKHMERFIEDELAKRRNATATGPASSSAFSSSTAPTLGDIAASAAATASGAVSLMPDAIDEELYAVPDHLRVARPEIKEGSVTSSAAMLTAIPEVELGTDVRKRAAKQTHATLSALDAAHAMTEDDPTDRDLAFANNPFPAMRWRISRRTRESLFDLHVAEDLLRDKRGRTPMGIVTNDESLKEQIERERRVGEGGVGHGARLLEALLGPDAKASAAASNSGDGESPPPAKRARR
ncbi:hypothetical protein BC828DRAFT_382635 [Blastocladiella britannica]|nr:hypothetical protein BC828DRAFT_382635 [Blastocladiella britannica]